MSYNFRSEIEAWPFGDSGDEDFVLKEFDEFIKRLKEEFCHGGLHEGQQICSSCYRIDKLAGPKLVDSPKEQEHKVGSATGDSAELIPEDTCSHQEVIGTGSQPTSETKQTAPVSEACKNCKLPDNAHRKGKLTSFTKVSCGKFEAQNQTCNNWFYPRGIPLGIHGKNCKFEKFELQPEDEPLLGLATTRELLDEIKARIEIHWDLDYRTIDKAGEDGN